MMILIDSQVNGLELCPEMHTELKQLQSMYGPYSKDDIIDNSISYKLFILTADDQIQSTAAISGILAHTIRFLSKHVTVASFQYLVGSKYN